MKKKFIFLTIIGTYLLFILSAPIGLAITSEIVIDVDQKEIDEPIKLSQSKDITLKVKFRLELSGLLERFYLKRRIGRVLAFGLLQGYFFKYLTQPTANLSLSLYKPDWCQAELNENNVELVHSADYQEMILSLTISLDKDAPAFKESDITIIANFPGQGMVSETSNSTNISFMPAYVSNITAESKSDFSISPNKENTISINVTNSGNGKSMINISGFEKDKWSIAPEQDTVIDVGETKEIMILVTPPKKFDNESITFSLKPISTVENVDDKYRQGENVDLSITFLNDGSLKDEEDDDIDITFAIIIAFVIIIILIIVFLILRKKE
jgi:hypothetical protein